VYVSFDGHRSDDFAPYVYVSTDFGQTWKSIRANLPAGPVYVIKEDTHNPNLLFVGTEFGLFASLDRGATWTPWKSLQTVAVYDLVVHPRDNDLVLATHGRSIQVFDDISPLQQLSEDVLASNSHLFDIRPATEFIPNESGWFMGGREYAAPNPEFGAYINYYLKAAAKQDVTIRISDTAGNVVRELKAAKEAGLHRVAWDLRTTPAAPATIGFYFQPDITNLGPFVLPDEYHVTLWVDGQEQSKTARVLGDPLVQISPADRRKLYDTLLTLTSMQTTMETIRATITRLDEQLKQMTEALKQHPEAPSAVTAAVENATKQARDLRARAIGGVDPAAAGAEGGAGGGRRALRGRLNGLKSYVILSQSLPTAAQDRQVEQCTKDLDQLVTQVNTWIATTLPNLQKQLDDNNIRPTIGEPIKPVAR
jgi:hypothetical protein